MKRNFEVWFKKYRLHLLIWILFILYESVSIGLAYHVYGTPLTYVAHYLLIIWLFYLHANWSLPWALKNKRKIFWKLPFILTIEILAFILLSFLTDNLLIIFHILPENKLLRLNFQYTLKNLFRDIYFIGFSTGYYFLLTYNKEKRKTNELEKQRLTDIIYRQKSDQELTKAQNAFLKAQINPHFLFNTLDFVYHRIVGLSPAAADAVVTLAEMMRYAIDSDKMGDYIPLGDELDQVENLLYLHQIRKNQKMLFLLEYEEELRQLYLIPLVLLTLVENIFKHGNLTEKGHDAFVHIFIKNDLFYIETDNLINHQTKTTGSHKGLSNTSQRLQYAYGENVIFNYEANLSNHFKVLLVIPVNQLKFPGENSISLTYNDK